MKKVFCLFIGIVLSFALVSCGAGADTPAEDNPQNATSGNIAANRDYFEWSATDDTQIVGYTELGLQQTELAIPEDCTSVQGLDNNVTVKHIRFENANTKILSTTFNLCTNLETIELPANLTEIENDVFNECSNLKSITLPDTVTEIGSNAFADCIALETVTLSNNIQTIGRQAFSGCTSLQSVSIPMSVREIGKRAFQDCSSLAELTFGNGIETIEESAFQNCTSLKSVTLPDSVTTLGGWAFAYCDALEEIYLPASIESVEVSSIAQTHNITVYVVEGSYMDGKISELMGGEFYNKQYQ